MKYQLNLEQTLEYLPMHYMCRAHGLNQDHILMTDEVQILATIIKPRALTTAEQRVLANVPDILYDGVIDILVQASDLATKLTYDLY